MAKKEKQPTWKESIEKRPVGRPRTTIDDLPKDWQQVMKDSAQEGGGVTSWMVRLGLNNHAWMTLTEDSQEFRMIVEECNLLCKDWWETTGRGMCTGKPGNSNVWGMNMANRFGWNSNRNQIVGDPNAPVQQNVTVANRQLSKEELLAELEVRGLPTALLTKD